MLQMCLNGKNTVIIWLLCFISSDLVYYLMFINYYTLKTTSLKVLFIFVDLHHFFVFVLHLLKEVISTRVFEYQTCLFEINVRLG